MFSFYLLKPILPVVEYFIWKDQIIENYCINKSQPVLKCDGKCYLAQKIKQANQSQDDSPNLVPVQLSDFAIGFIQLEELIVLPELEASQHPLLQHFYHFDFVERRLRPPGRG
ncbi:MAG: hypothetical protein AAF206_21400 [Bacteroidota bacterium]